MFYSPGLISAAHFLFISPGSMTVKLSDELYLHRLAVVKIPNKKKCPFIEF
jgi:hypothetical protein